MTCPRATLSGHSLTALLPLVLDEDELLDELLDDELLEDELLDDELLEDELLDEEELDDELLEFGSVPLLPPQPANAMNNESSEIRDSVYIEESVLCC